MENQKSGGAFTGGLVFSATVVIYLFLSLIYSVVVSILGVSAETSDAVIYINYLVAPIAVAAGIAIVLKVRKVPFGELMPLKIPARQGVRWYIVAVLLAFGLLFTLSWLNVGFERLLRLCGYKNQPSYFPDLSGGGVALALLVMAVIPAFAEETLFRGVILQSIKQDIGEIFSILLCGMCFALFHASALQTIYQFICGCAFALLAVRARSVGPCMLAHFLNNAVIIIMQAAGGDTSGTIFDLVPLWAASAITVLSTLSLIAAIVLMFRGAALVRVDGKKGIKDFFLASSAGIAVLVILWIAGLFA